MKTKPQAFFAAAALVCGLSASSVLAQGNSGNNGNSGTSGSSGTANALIPAQPAGYLSAYPTIVQTGAHPTLTWNILHPSSVSNVAVINPPGTITITQNNVYVSVQPVGTGTTDCTSTETASQRFTEARLGVNGANYVQLFYGKTADVTSQYSLYIKKHKTGDVLDFGGRYVKNNNWSPFYTTRSSNMQVVTLKNGDALPTTFPLHSSPQLAGYLGPYLDASGKVKIGPMSVLVLMELGSTNRNQLCYDYQDMILLVTFSNRHANNGHGNNLDGVDSSNPGRGQGGPTGLNNTGQDPSGGVDDEIR